MSAPSTIMNSSLGSAGPGLMNRREAIRRTALLLGAAISPSVLTGIMTAAPVAAGANARPSFLDANQFATAAAAAERILPRTDTPGAADVGVPVFIDRMYGRFMTADEQRVFASGLGELDMAATASHDRRFPRLTAPEQDQLLKAVAEASQDKERTFFHHLKELTLLGYFTSEPVAKTVLHYDPIPGPYRGCIPISETGNAAWTPLR